MATLIVMIGPSGSGKTTYREHFDGEVVCLDEIREELTGDAGDQSRNDEAAALSRERIDAHLGAGRDVLVDETSLVPAHRIDLVDLAYENNAELVAVLLATRVTTCISRQLRRVRRVPENVIRLQHAALPNWQDLVAEGFNHVEVTNG